MSAEFDGFEGEICTGRAAIDVEGWISDAKIPEQCRECLERALKTETAIVIESNHYIDAVQRLGGLAVFNPVDAAMWQATTMRVPGQGWTREFEVAQGFDDMEGQSYEFGTETEVKSILFSCDD